VNKQQKRRGEKKIDAQINTDCPVA